MTQRLIGNVEATAGDLLSRLLEGWNIYAGLKTKAM